MEVPRAIYHSFPFVVVKNDLFSLISISTIFYKFFFLIWGRYRMKSFLLSLCRARSKCDICESEFCNFGTFRDSITVSKSFESFFLDQFGKTLFFVKFQD